VTQQAILKLLTLITLTKVNRDNQRLKLMKYEVVETCCEF